MEAQYMNRVQLYAENTNIKYPLDDESDGNIAKDILADLSLTLPQGCGAYLTNLVRTSSYLFLSIEDDNRPVAHLFLTDPVAFQIYPLTMHTDGSGFVVFGPGCSKNCNHKRIRAPIDMRCIVPDVLTDCEFKLVVNGEEYPMPSVLTLASNYFIAAARETRNISGLGDTADVLTLKRNDSKLSSDIIKYGLVKGVEGELPLLTINGIPPDENGNFVLTFDTEDPAESVTLVPVKSREGTPLGFILITDGMHGCLDEYKRLMQNIKKSDTGEGVIWELPLDCVFKVPGTDCPPDEDCPKDCCPRTYPPAP